ncbi:hypothetical protein PoB_004690900 [Plakobranchus ocellatus]|uniref:Uncharacterized protein n=1 Tax=Plakobranchus ocellatus TaxID=259542 RepID=A0AAV4BJU1_9GAST|nr:hypothetical protein PoB_004690900 [Plakobranchus ocellatus]
MVGETDLGFYLCCRQQSDLRFSGHRRRQLKLVIESFLQISGRIRKPFGHPRARRIGENGNSNNEEIAENGTLSDRQRTPPSLLPGQRLAQPYSAQADSPLRISKITVKAISDKRELPQKTPVYRQILIFFPQHPFMQAKSL